VKTDIYISGLTTHSKNRATWLLSLLTLGRSEGKAGRLPKIDQNFNVSFPTTACSPTFHKTNVLHNDLKKDAINEFGIKYWTSNHVRVKFQEHGSSFYVNIEEKVWLLERLTGRRKLRFLTEIERFHWNQGEEVATSPGLVSPVHLEKNLLVLVQRTGP
jgi:hypothetical protein